MAYKVKDYGNGSLGDVNSISATINSYARVTAISTSTITINSSTQITGTATFEVGAKVLIHVSATTSSSYKTYLGCYLLANVTAVNGEVLTLDEDPTTCIPSANFSQYYVQAIAVAQYKNLTLPSGVTITPPVYSAVSYIGGIVALMCSESLVFNGGHIDLVDKGIPVANKSLRPTTNNDVASDQQSYAAWENSDTQTHFLLNAGDGAAFVIAKSMTCHTDSRIGNTATKGVQFYRGATNSVTYNETAPSNVTNVGGSTILIAAETITNFTCNMFAKYRSTSLTTGQGICRCYIASETKLRNDEGLYAYDCISKKSRIKDMNIKSFGNGSFGDITNPTGQLNNYAKVTAINGNKVTYTGATTEGLAPFAQGALVMIHWNHKGSTYITDAGRFILANVLDEYNGVLTLDTAPPDISISNYACQVVSIPQAKIFTLSSENSSTLKYNGTIGGICAIAASDTCNLSTGKINTKQKGGGNAYAREGLAVIGNAQDNNKLPIGQGNGSVFILANKLVMNTSTRIGATYSGSKLNGSVYFLEIGSWREYYLSGGGYSGYYRNTKSYPAVIASGAAGGQGFLTTSQPSIGGYGSSSIYNSQYPENAAEGAQGSHVFIVSNTIQNYNQSAISTGGANFNCPEASYGGAGYGAGGRNTSTNEFYYTATGGYNGGGGAYSSNDISGGSSGWAFVYCNEAVNQDTTGTVLDN